MLFWQHISPLAKKPFVTTVFTEISTTHRWTVFFPKGFLKYVTYPGSGCLLDFRKRTFPSRQWKLYTLNIKQFCNFCFEFLQNSQVKVIWSWWLLITLLICSKTSVVTSLCSNSSDLSSRKAWCSMGISPVYSEIKTDAKNSFGFSAMALLSLTEPFTPWSWLYWFTQWLLASNVFFLNFFYD